MKKRYQYYGPNGITWTSWFEVEYANDKYQYGKKLLNEYKK